MRKLVLALMILAAGCLLSFVPAAGEDIHPLSVHDMVAMDRISDPRVSPDARTIAFVLRVTDLEANKGRTDLWVVGSMARVSSGSPPIRRTTGTPGGLRTGSTSTSSRRGRVVSGLAPEGRWRRSATGDDQPLDLDNLVVSPDGGRLAFTMEVFTDCDTPECTKKRSMKREKGKGLRDRFRSAVRPSLDVERRTPVARFRGECRGQGRRRCHEGQWTPTARRSPLAARRRSRFAPDGRAIVFHARDVGREEAWSTDFDLYLAPIDGSKPRSVLPKRTRRGTHNRSSRPTEKRLRISPCNVPATRRTLSRRFAGVARGERASSHRGLGPFTGTIVWRTTGNGSSPRRRTPVRNRSSAST